MPHLLTSTPRASVHCLSVRGSHNPSLILSRPDLSLSFSLRLSVPPSFPPPTPPPTPPSFPPPFPSAPQVLIKYGVVSLSSLVSDLRCWPHLFLAGRLHKPVAPLLPLPPALRQGMPMASTRCGEEDEQKGAFQGDPGVGRMGDGKGGQQQQLRRQQEPVQQRQQHGAARMASLAASLAANRRAALAAALLGMPAATPFSEVKGRAGGERERGGRAKASFSTVSMTMRVAWSVR